ncbi:MAG: hypothetical protein RMH84_00620 [Sulfolobales archaeon]|nr:hypothetical protein [Sulfolobales archaeon]MCX8208090.1 hypothetical protein [Sulfolobales archaeon]MDW8010090.1 hypothetical protein [Sulfolobales archaeon]
MPLKLSFSNISAVASAIRKSYGQVVSVVENFTDPQYYPPENSSVEDVLRYFFFMVAIDHRTSRFRPFEGYVRGKFHHGADLLYRLGMLKYEEDPSFFSPERMANLSTREVVEWLRTPGGDAIWDPDVRTELLRDAGIKLIKYFGGSVLNFIKASGSYIRHPTSRCLGILFKVFKAYSDPVEKKMFLFIKFTLRRSLLAVKDIQNLEVPVDNHLTRIALRLKLVELDEEMSSKIVSRAEVSDREDVELRMAVRRAYSHLSRLSGVRQDYLDDYLWILGRKICTRENPACERSGFCPLSSVCASCGNASKIVEHNYVNTYYY